MTDFDADQDDKFAQENGYVLGWATVSLTGKNLRSLHFKSLPNSKPDEWYSYAQALLNWHAFPKLIAFDDWIGNIDRNPGNLVFIKDSEFAIIDHGRVLGVIDWFKQQIDPNDNFPNLMLGMFKFNYPDMIIAPILYTPIIHETQNQALTIATNKSEIITRMGTVFSNLGFAMKQENWEYFFNYFEARLGTAPVRIPASLAA